MNDNIINILANNNYIILNKSLIKELGLKETIILGELASEYNYYKSNNMLNDGWFYSTVENVKNETSLSDYEQRIAINNLKDKKIISMIIKGIPAKRYIKINTLIIGNLLLNNLRTSSQKIKELDVENFDTNNNNINNNNNNIYNYIQKKLGRVLSPIECELISKWEIYSKEDIKECIDKAFEMNKYSIQYINTMLYNKKNKPKEVIKNTSNDVLPSWFNNEDNIEIEPLSEEEQKEMDQLMSKYQD